MYRAEDLFAIKRYFVPYPPEDLFIELEKSINPHEILPGCKKWVCLSEGDRTRR